MLRTITALVGLVACLLGGCSTRTVADGPYAFDVSGPIAIDVEIFAGDVEIVADPRLTQAAVRLERESSHGADRGDEAMTAMEEIGFAVDIVPGELGQVLQVQAQTLHAEPHFQRVNVVVDVPMADGVTVHTSRGRVKVRNVQGALDIRTTERDVLVVTERPLLEPVSITTSYADIDLRCRGESTGELDLRAVGGRVHQKIRFGETIVHPGTRHDTLLASFNGGRNPVMMRTVDGDIRFVVESNPAAFGHYIIP